MKHEFILVFKLPNKQEDPRVHADALRRCSGILPSFGVRGHLVLDIQREGRTKAAAKRDAIFDVLKAVPDATLDEMLMVD